MITCMFLKNYKAYDGINFIPITLGENFCVFFGINGIGKSSILEALDSYFNDRSWNINRFAKSRGGFGYINTPYVIPVFLLKNDDLPIERKEDREAKENIIKLGNYVWNIARKDINNSSKDATDFIDYRDKLKTLYDVTKYSLVPIGKRYDDYGNVYFGIFHHQKTFLNTFGIDKISDSDDRHYEKEDEFVQTKFKGLNEYIANLYSYIYIPSDIDVQNYTKLESADMQKLMHKDVQDEIRKAITQPKLDDINSSLQSFLDSISDKLKDYNYRKPSAGKSNITMPDLVSKIIESYFSIRVLSKKSGESYIPVNQLSSGEKRKALVDLAYAFLNDDQKHEKQIILAIDEPEVSLHVSSCFEQFEKLKKISGFSHQVIITTHWYGFLPITSSGIAHNTYCEKINEIEFNTYSLANYREEMVVFKRRNKGKLPFDVYLKSTNDLVQSIISSLRTDQPYSYILCEGTSDQIYLKHYLSDLVETKRLRILPLGGCGEIMRIMRSISLSLEDRDTEIRGIVFGIIDTDKEYSKAETIRETKNIFYKRIIFDKNDTKLVNADSSEVNPETQIEDVLNPKAFAKVLEDYSEHPVSKIVNCTTVNEKSNCTYNCIDYRQSERDILRDFFDIEGRKVEFAKKYINTVSSDHAIPSIFIEIRSYFEKLDNDKPKKVAIVKIPKRG